MSFYKQLTAIVLGLVLLISTTGIPVHALYCMCKGEWSVSFFAEAEMTQCASDSSEGEGCCNAAKNCCTSLPIADDHNCDKEETWFAKLSTVFLSQLDQDQSDVKNFSVFKSFVLSVDQFLASNGKGVDRTKWDPRFLQSPLGASARYILFQQFRC